MILLILLFLLICGILLRVFKKSSDLLCSSVILFIVCLVVYSCSYFFAVNNKTYYDNTCLNYNNKTTENITYITLTWDEETTFFEFMVDDYNNYVSDLNQIKSNVWIGVLFYSYKDNKYLKVLKDK
jgi:4-amino-4-deoxy-L-arabinose transferase-like glycosyltransferase